MKPAPHILIIFGASGDLTERKLIPALFDLYCQSLLPDGFIILGVGRTVLSDTEFRTKLREKLADHSNCFKQFGYKAESFAGFIHYCAIDTNKQEDYALLKKRLDDLDRQFSCQGNYLYYLATPPGMYHIIPHYLQHHNLHKPSNSSSWRRIIIEKPFGSSLESARELNQQLLAIFDEKQIFRIDHYLGKETVQNILVFRFSNGFFEPLWNRNYIQKVEITAGETIGIENRGGYYEGAGAIRDMIQNHLLQLVALTAMEPPSLFDAHSLRNETMKVFQALHPLSHDDIMRNVICGQYTACATENGYRAAYRDEKGVDPHSKTETFVAMKFFIDNWRWGGVPFYIRTGKRLPARVTEIVIHLKATPYILFKGQCRPGDACNRLIIRIQPDESISLHFGLKVPGAGYEVQQVKMDFNYTILTNAYIPSAYERLLLDCMLGDSSLYIRGDAVEATWKFIDPVLHEIAVNPDFKIYGYPCHTWGPEQAIQLMDGNWNIKTDQSGTESEK